MKMKRSAIWASLIGLSALVLAWGFLKAKELSLNKMRESYPVLIAKKDILQGMKLDISMVELSKAPRRFLQPAALSSLDAIVGMVTAAPILQGEQILETKLVSIGAATGLSVKIPQDQRALSIEVDEVSGVAGLIKPNDFIDLLATFEMEDSSETLQTATYTLAQKVLVLAVNDDLGNPFNPEIWEKRTQAKGLFASKGFSDVAGMQRRKTLTLALSPQQVQEIEFAKNSGTLAVALRSKLDGEPIELGPVTAFDVVGFKGRLRKANYREYRGR
ncbi:MAG: Flp pilus assembly protein CpaB [Deltaproteobacteria bacterium RIFCSPLOWO2_12_FULL_44_12]|nr:MAG: Flp pilus assembly protein CpaB [Deltaproteobacteria bacterium RIFCSPHIGHO2_01_FULL_43_49]OGQ15872.1 MAG: Flp pilus assembly protein CpaB [Deltaproteobacteria bacterium RIFCSPHIGHO2_02_FULL_44_53]OGQ28826.1 MAG: Flp pilus assembly protein CpaB [Deltaproteobacteria bacterium RIFCSPHIGHO2_12_FULL_44_21]OGQ32146.1 MAG: Flp pilus assembly protein CpaB [Deltaproteobacteria bacterium RIFCSPLOWO2_01_FULL_45_74]OGQ43711.1 MAG: Flp pilus assembly protein CpaB [Deltaproteobacteria bacterium RIFCS